MRKALVIIIIISAFFILGPWFAGFYFQHRYTELLAFYNSKSNWQLTITDYKRGWWSSDFTVNVVMKSSELDDVVKFLNIDSQSLSPTYAFTVQGHVQHGPIFYHKLADIPSMFGWAAVENKVILTDELADMMKSLGVDGFTVQSDNGFISLFGNYFNHLALSPMQITYPGTDEVVYLNGTQTNFWIWPKRGRVKGNVLVDQLQSSTSDVAFDISKIKIVFDQYRQNGIWLGKYAIDVPTFLYAETQGSTFSMTGLHFGAQTSLSKGKLSGMRVVNIDHLQLDDESAGPLNMELSADKLNLDALEQMLTTYQDIQIHGEAYQDQLDQKISMLLPEVVGEGTNLKVSKFTLVAPQGTMVFSGEVSWPDSNFVAYDNVSDTVSAAKADFEFKISKKLSDHVLHLLSGMPNFIRDASDSDHQLLLDTRDQLEFAARKNRMMIYYLTDNHEITDSIADKLLDLEQDMVPMSEYGSVVKKYYLLHQISLTASYMLYWQYSQVQDPYMMLMNKVDEYQKSVEDQFQGQVKEFLHQGYLLNQDDEYVTNVVWAGGRLLVNGH